MVSPTLVAKSEATVAKILAAAEGLFLARNYADVTMDQIAEAGRVTKGGLYHHFAGKDELYLAMMHADLAAKQALFGEAIAAGGGCLERLRRLTAAFFDLPRDKQELIKLVRRDINVFREPMRADLIHAYQTALPDLVEEVIRDGIRDGELAAADARLLAWHFVAMVEVTFGQFADGLLVDTDAKLDHVLNLFIGGAGAQRRGRKR